MSTNPDISAAEWIKSSYSGSGAGNCLEWAPTAWAKSSYSGDGGDNCLEWARSGPPGIIPIRDSKTPDGPVLTFSPAAWAAFVSAV
ncbi:DUF397 domain-containing protein [Streptomyces aureoversilis]|uniref:DUF397 domain-containing protein n=1 Tax=Streptomyces aureoversilis TaxID=67277 RepID=A0ABV9ZWK9_9ACTN